MEDYIVGIDHNNAVFVAPRTWKKSETEVLWPPHGLKDIERRIKQCEVPDDKWTVFSCTWTSFASSKKKITSLCRVCLIDNINNVFFAYIR